MSTISPTTDNPPVVCPTFEKTLEINAVWSPDKHGAGTETIKTSNYGGMGPDDCVLIKFNTGPGNSEPGHWFQIQAGSETSGSETGRLLTISKSSCDQSGQKVQGSTLLAQTTIGPNTIGAVALDPGTDYYVLIWNNPADVAGSNGPFDLIINLSFPRRQ